MNFIKRRINNSKKMFVILLSLFVALIHLLGIGKYLPNTLSKLYQGYFSDIAIPFCFYFLFSIAELKHRIFLKRYVKAIIIFFAASFAEIMQFIGIYFLGTTFDPFDFLMYGISVILAVFFERKFFDRQGQAKNK